MTFNRSSYRGRGGGRGGQQKSKSTSKDKVVEKKKKTITDYTYYMGSAKQASDFETTTQFVINHIKKTYEYGNDIGTALKLLEPMQSKFAKPVLAVSSAADADTKEQENKS